MPVPFDFTTLEPVPVGATNCFAIDTGEGLLLIDTGVNAEQFWHALVGGLEARGYNVADVRWVLLTHAHLDHCGLVPRLRQAAPGVQVLIHRAEVQFLRQGGMHARQNLDLYLRLYREHGTPADLLDWFLEADRAGWAKNWRLEPRLFGPAPERPLRDDLYATPQDLPEGERMQKWEGAPSEPDVVFDDGAVLEFGPLRLRAIHTPGHTPGHCSFYHEESGVIFTGDHVLKRTTPNPGLYFIDNQYERRTRSVPDYLRSLEKLQQFECRLLLGAHEAPMDDLQAATRRLIKHHEERAVEALDAIRRGRQTTFGVLPFLFPNLRRNGLFQAVGETLGHMDLLEDRGQAVAEPVDGRILYRAVA